MAPQQEGLLWEQMGKDGLGTREELPTAAGAEFWEQPVRVSTAEPGRGQGERAFLHLTDSWWEDAMSRGNSMRTGPQTWRDSPSLTSGLDPEVDLAF